MRTTRHTKSSRRTVGTLESSEELTGNQQGDTLSTPPEASGVVGIHARYQGWVAVCASCGLPEIAARRIWGALQPVADEMALAGAARGWSLAACEEAAASAVGDLIRLELAGVARG